MTHRLIFGSSLIAATGALTWFDMHYGFGKGFSMLTGLLILTGLYEFFQMLRQKGIQPYVLAGMLGTTAYLALIWWQLQRPDAAGATHAGGIVLMLTMLFIVLGEMLRGSPADITSRLAGTLLGILYVGYLGSYFLRLLYLDGHAPLLGLKVLVLVVACAKSGDIGAYFTGRAFGKHKLFPDISPKKTIEGAIGGIIISMLVVICMTLWMQWPDFFNFGEALTFGFAIGALSQTGDLAESMVKRDTGVKDSGRLIPVMGGVLDLVDSLLFIGPAAYFLLLFFQAHR